MLPIGIYMKTLCVGKELSCLRAKVYYASITLALMINTQGTSTNSPINLSLRWQMSLEKYVSITNCLKEKNYH